MISEKTVLLLKNAKMYFRSISGCQPLFNLNFHLKEVSEKYPVSEVSCLDFEEKKIVVKSVDENDRLFFMIIFKLKKLIIFSVEKYSSLRPAFTTNRLQFSEDSELDFYFSDLIDEICRNSLFMLKRTICTYKEIHNMFLKLRSKYYKASKDFNPDIISHLDFLVNEKAIENMKSMLDCVFHIQNELYEDSSSENDFKSKIGKIKRRYNIINAKYTENLLLSEELVCLIDQEEIFF